MEENKQKERKVIKISRKKLIVSIVVLVAVLIIGWIVLSLGRATLGSPRMYNDSSVASLSAPLGATSSSGELVNPTMPYDDSYRYQNQNASIKDTREFLKTNYDSTLKTRDVSGVIKQVKNIVKGADGRIDRFYSTEKYGSVRFVVAKSKFDAFKDEIEGITHKKLYVESISSENLLSEKQGIEGQIKDANSSLDSLISQRTTLTDNHNKTLSVLNKELTRINSELVKVKANIAALKNNEINISLSEQETSLIDQQANQKQNINQENKNYSTQKQDLDNLISYANANVNVANKEDSKFMDNIETVNGEVNVEWVSLWEIAVIFSPIHPTLIIIILIIAAFIIFRK
jgi:hypothetical protein